MELVTAEATFKSAACTEVGFVTPLTVNEIRVFALNVPAVSVTVITRTGAVPLNTAALALAPLAGDENATAQPLHVSPEPLSVTINLPVDGVTKVGVSDTVITAPDVALDTMLSVTVNACEWTCCNIPKRMTATIAE